MRKMRSRRTHCGDFWFIKLDSDTIIAAETISMSSTVVLILMRNVSQYFFKVTTMAHHFQPLNSCCPPCIQLRSNTHNPRLISSDSASLGMLPYPPVG